MFKSLVFLKQLLAVFTLFSLSLSVAEADDCSSLLGSQQSLTYPTQNLFLMRNQSLIRELRKEDWRTVIIPAAEGGKDFDILQKIQDLHYSLLTSRQIKILTQYFGEGNIPINQALREGTGKYAQVAKSIDQAIALGPTLPEGLYLFRGGNLKQGDFVENGDGTVTSASFISSSTHVETALGYVSESRDEQRDHPVLFIIAIGSFPIHAAVNPFDKEMLLAPGIKFFKKASGTILDPTNGGTPLTVILLEPIAERGRKE